MAQFAALAAILVVSSLGISLIMIPSLLGDIYIMKRTFTFDEPCDTVKLPGTAGRPTLTASLRMGFGSGAFRHAADPKGVFYTIADRGPSFSCKGNDMADAEHSDSSEKTGGRRKKYHHSKRHFISQVVNSADGFAAISADNDTLSATGIDVCTGGKIFAMPHYSPTIFRFYSDKQSRPLLQAIQLKAHGKAVTGIPPAVSIYEKAFDRFGNFIEPDPNGFDTEAIVKLRDDTFWVGEEYAPSIAHVGHDGEILTRLVPYGVKEQLKGASYPIVEALPRILQWRAVGRGIESLAVSKDERWLYFLMQSPLFLPDKKAFRDSPNTRMFKVDRKMMEVVAEYVYVLDDYESYSDDPDANKQSNVKTSEMVMLPDGQLLVDEHISRHTKLYKVDLDSDPPPTNILGSEYDDPDYRPSLEQLDLSDEQYLRVGLDKPIRIVPLSKKLLLDSAKDLDGDLPSKIEGMAVSDSKSLILTNDNDFGKKNDVTHFVFVRAHL